MCQFVTSLAIAIVSMRMIADRVRHAGSSSSSKRPKHDTSLPELSEHDWWICSQLKLDSQAVKAIRRLALELPDQKQTFMAVLEDKLDKGSLKKPSNFVITCVNNAFEKA